MATTDFLSELRCVALTPSQMRQRCGFSPDDNKNLDAIFGETLIESISPGEMDLFWKAVAPVPVETKPSFSETIKKYKKEVKKSKKESKKESKKKTVVWEKSSKTSTKNELTYRQKADNWKAWERKFKKNYSSFSSKNRSMSN